MKIRAIDSCNDTHVIKNVNIENNAHLNTLYTYKLEWSYFENILHNGQVGFLLENI